MNIFAKLTPFSIALLEMLVVQNGVGYQRFIDFIGLHARNKDIQF
jgi:hypothetical protein